MGIQMQEIFERYKALELAKEVEKAKEDMTKQLNVEAVTRLVVEQYKKAQSLATKQGKEHTKTFNDIIADDEDIDNGEVFDIKSGQTIRDL